VSMTIEPSSTPTNKQLLEALTAAYATFAAADKDWQAALVVVYGKDAGDARYDERGYATPELDSLKAAVRVAKEAHHEAYVAFTRVLWS
jgi:hypothetical protein